MKKRRVHALHPQQQQQQQRLVQVSPRVSSLLVYAYILSVQTKILAKYHSHYSHTISATAAASPSTPAKTAGRCATAA